MTDTDAGKYAVRPGATHDTVEDLPEHLIFGTNYGILDGPIPSDCNAQLIELRAFRDYLCAAHPGCDIYSFHSVMAPKGYKRPPAGFYAEFKKIWSKNWQKIVCEYHTNHEIDWNVFMQKIK